MENWRERERECVSLPFSLSPSLCLSLPLCVCLPPQAAKYTDLVQQARSNGYKATLYRLCKLALEEYHTMNVSHSLPRYST